MGNVTGRFIIVVVFQFEKSGGKLFLLKRDPYQTRQHWVLGGGLGQANVVLTHGLCEGSPHVCLGLRNDPRTG